MVQVWRKQRLQLWRDVPVLPAPVLRKWDETSKAKWRTRRVPRLGSRRRRRRDHSVARRRTPKSWPKNVWRREIFRPKRCWKSCMQPTSHWTPPGKMCFQMVLMLWGVCCWVSMPWLETLESQMLPRIVHGLCNYCQALPRSPTQILNLLQFKWTKIMHRVRMWTRTTWARVWLLDWETTLMEIFGSMTLRAMLLLNCKRTFHACITMKQVSPTMGLG